MVEDRLLTEVMSSFSATVVGEFSPADVLRELAHGVVRVLGADGAGVMVPRDEALLRFAFAAGPDEQAVVALERLQEQLQDGPCSESRTRREIIDIADLAVEGRWPVFQAEAVRAGLHGATTLPLVARDRVWGVLDLYRRTPRRLRPDELAAAQTLAQVATSYLVVTADRDDARQAQSELAYRAMHDPLTGLPVRWVFLEQLTHALARLERHSGQVGVLFADLDGLKYVNDTYGHEAGDRLLLTCVERIRTAVRPIDVLARVGGDEFVVLLEDLGSADDGAAVAQRILAELARPYRPDGHVLQPSASLGLALTGDTAMRPAALIAHADSAMYRAKRSGRGRYELFDAVSYAAERERATEHVSTSQALLTALRTGQLTVHYQPVVDLTAGRRDRSPATALAYGPVHAVEALVRWEHPSSGTLPAADFVPQAERDGLLPELDAFVITTACAQLVRWDRELGARAPAGLFVNVGAGDLVDPEFPDRLAAVLSGTGLAAHRLTLEVTETGLITDSPAPTHVLQALQELGCSIAIDDFGTGWSSLSRLVELPATTWKVDRSFASDLGSRPAAVAVVAAVLQLGRQLQRTVVVEGVEDDDSLETLLRLGCTHAQGDRLGRPQDADRTRALLLGPLGTVTERAG